MFDSPTVFSLPFAFGKGFPETIPITPLLYQFITFILLSCLPGLL